MGEVPRELEPGMMCPAVSWWDAPGRLPAGKRNWDDDFSKGGNAEVVPLQRGEVPHDRQAGESAERNCGVMACYISTCAD